MAFFLALISLLTACSFIPWTTESYIAALERPERDAYQKPEEVIAALDLKPGMVVADIGAGSGYFTRRLAQAVGPTGKVLAVDIEPAMLDYNRSELLKQGLADRVEFLLASPHDPSLPSRSIDLIFLCNVYHHVEDPVDYISRLKAGLRPSGRVVIIDFYHDERSGDLNFPKHHLVPRDRVITVLRDAGFRLSREHLFLPKQYFLEFEIAPLSL